MFSSISDTFKRIALFGVLLISFLLLPIQSLWAAACVPPPSPVPCRNNSNCDDGDPCNGQEFCDIVSSNDVFIAFCECGTAPPDNTVACASDGVFCNGTELCVNFGCTGHTGDPCVGSGNECADVCNVTSDVCGDPAGTACTDSDGNLCTAGQCNGTGSCIPTPTSLPCDDGVNCTESDICAGGACNGSPVQCDDNISCTLDACDESDGSCGFDADQCECQADADCDDNNVCTDEFCCTDPKACGAGTTFTCVRSNNTGTCDDNLFCNGPDTCSGGTCGVHAGDPCTDGEQCDATCDEIGDTCFAPRGTTCEDGDFRTINECDGGGKCSTVETFSTQGSTLGCSLNPQAQAPDFGRIEAGLRWGAWFLSPL